MLSYPIDSFASNASKTDRNIVYKTDDISIKFIATDNTLTVHADFHFLIKNKRIDQLKALALDTENLTHWFSGLSKANVIQHSSQNNEKHIHIVSDMPFPVRDREIAIKQTLRHDSDLKVEFDLAADYTNIPPNWRLVRVNTYQGTWTFTQQGNHVQVHMTAVYDPHILNLPRKAAISKVAYDAYHTVENLKNYSPEKQQANIEIN